MPFNLRSRVTEGPAPSSASYLALHPKVGRRSQATAEFTTAAKFLNDFAA
ncbi:hypothetical protein SCP_1200960 [Sparassis crispa]|uniref:Uncharacterized protein n=1 Tax=Sparassis crispa TaxID=139825 RepID=A0A401H0D1_9APHY|nr:hypothetical protein SCP_1200960 [Sparassis crispa]GBE87871.1 hypothetical protein SCP_1200960 [Sparassis crispa]